jgi:hypothetical protein
MDSSGGSGVSEATGCELGTAKFQQWMGQLRKVLMTEMCAIEKHQTFRENTREVLQY